MKERKIDLIWCEYYFPSSGRLNVNRCQKVMFNFKGAHMLKANKCVKSLIFWLSIVLSLVGLILMFRCAFLKAPGELSDPKSSFLIPFLQIYSCFSYRLTQCVS